jgi:hypothetical protein
MEINLLQSENHNFVETYQSDIVPLIGDYIVLKDLKNFVVKERLFSTTNINAVVLIGEIKENIFGLSKDKENKKDFNELSEEPVFIDNICLSYRHDFGLMDKHDKELIRFNAKEWLRAIRNNI